MSEQSKNRLIGMKVLCLCFSPIATYIHTHTYIFFVVVVVVAWDLYLAGLKRIL